MANQTKIKLSIVVIGGGVGGLALAMFLRQDGHQVTVLERSDGSYGTRTTGGIALFNNSTSIMKRRQLFDRVIAPIADTGTTRSAYRYDGEFVGLEQKVLPHSFVHRGDISLTSSQVASELGADVRFNSIVKSISESANDVAVLLADGTEIRSDLVIGADGLNSFVRSQLFPDVKPQMSNSSVMLLYIPEAAMKTDPGTQELWNNEPYCIGFAPERNIVSWSMRKREVYHLQMCDYNYGNGEAYGGLHAPNAPYISIITDNSGLKKRWSDLGPRWQHIMNSTTEYYNWRIAEIPPMASYSSPEGRIWLMGDACHAVQPFAGQGANMAFEDAESIATLLAHISSSDEVPHAAKAYYTVRSPRLAGLRRIIEKNVKENGLPEGEEQRRRDASFRNGEETSVHSKESRLQVDAIDRMTRAENFEWMEAYDAVAETLKVWSQAS